MLRFIGIYAAAIIFAMSIAAYVKKNPIGLAPAHPSGNAEMALAAPQSLRQGAQGQGAQAFGAVVQSVENDGHGHYRTSVQSDGHDIPMLIDTGATFVSLTNEDASALGFHPQPAAFTLQMQTAKGLSKAAPVWLPRVRVGMVEVRDVEAIVMEPGASPQSLLGMSFLNKLHRFGVADGRMRLEQ